MPNRTMTRRAFCTRAATALAAPYVITSGALGAAGQPAASDRITMGTIGLGGRGRHDLNAFLANADVQMIAVCDCWAERLQMGKKIVDKAYGNQDCDTHHDFRDLLARKDIDAVLIATGDNWHALASVIAAKAGKDIYSEKPMSLTVAEGRAVADTVKRYGTLYQCGTQRRSIGRFQFAIEVARSGKLGELKTLYAEKAPFKVDGHRDTLPPQPEPASDVIDWDMWLGPAAWRPYNEAYLTRKFWAHHLGLSGGAITEWGSHTADLCQLANKAENTSCVEYELAEGTVVARYANGVKLVFEKGVWPLHVRFEGTEGWIYADDDGNVEAEPKSLIANQKFGKGYPQGNHVRNFLDCVKSRHTPASPAEEAHRSNTTCQIANICRDLGRKLQWDPEREQFVNDPMADRLLRRAMREPWRI